MVIVFFEDVREMFLKDSIFDLENDVQSAEPASYSLSW